MSATLDAGTRVRLTRMFGEYPIVPVAQFETGTIASNDDNSYWVTLDRHHRHLDAWQNQLQVSIVDEHGMHLPNLDDPDERMIEPIPANWTVKQIMMLHEYEPYHTGGGCMTWAKDKWTRWICTTDNGIEGDPDAMEWFVGTHDEECGFVECNKPMTLWRALRFADFLPMPILGDQIRFFDDRPDHQQIAAIFAVYLRQDLDADLIAEVNRRNKVETNPGVCHSHDFCDANMTMDSAYIALTGKSAALCHDKPEATGDSFDQDAGDAWGRAWDLARKHDFDPARILADKEA